MLPSSAEGLRAFDQVLLDACAIMRPPEKLSVSEWADKYFMLSPEGSARPGKWSTATAEYQREIMDCLSPGSRYETVVWQAPSQVGKTALQLIFMAYHVHHDPAPILFVEPDENLAKVVFRDRIDPMIRDNTALTPLFAGRGAKGGGNDSLRKSFPGGQLTGAWASSPTQLASRPIRILITDETGAMGSLLNREGNPRTLARARMATFKGNRKHFDASSPRLRRTCLITQAFEASDQRHYYVPCPQCGHMQTLRWEHLHWPTIDGKPDTRACYYVCEANGCEILDSDKYRMVRLGKWIAHNPGGGDGRTAGFHLSALYSTIGYTWPELIDEYLACEGMPERLQAFVNTKLGLPWDEEAEGIELSEVAKHAEPYPAEAPMWCLLATIGADVQKDRVEATRWGWGVRESGVLEHRVFHGDPTLPDVWRDFDAWRRREVEHESGLTIPTSCTFVDSGDGNRTQAVYEYTRRRVRERVFACKGSSQHGAPLVNRGSRVGRFRTWLFAVGTSTAKDIIYARLKISDKDRPGYIHFPDSPEAGCDAEYFAQLTAEKLVTHRTKSGEESRWEAQRKRNEALDCAVYSHAAKEYLRAPMAELASRMEQRIARLTATGVLQQRLAQRAATPPASPSAVSSPASPSPRVNPSPTPQIKAKNKKRIIKRPGFAWIHAAAEVILPETPRRSVRAFLRDYLR